WLIVASLAGAPRHPAWFFNMAKNPSDIWLEVGTERFKVGGESLEGQERTEALARIAAIAPRYGTYQQKTDREIPVVRLTREAERHATARRATRQRCLDPHHADRARPESAHRQERARAAACPRGWSSATGAFRRRLAR